jgi:hypothetical protein
MVDSFAPQRKNLYENLRQFSKSEFWKKRRVLEANLIMKSVLLVWFILFCLAIIPASSQDNPHYIITDPAIREMMVSMDMPKYAGGVPSDLAIREMMISMDRHRYARGVPGNVIGNWQLMLDRGRNIELTLQQLESVVFGKWTIIAGSVSQPLTASGSVSDNNLQLDIVPVDGSELYAISINFGSLPFVGTYAVFRADSAPKSGALQASWTLPVT